MTEHSQPGDVRVNRGNLLRRIGRACFAHNGGQPGLPAPVAVTFHPSLSLGFETLGEVAEWVARYDLHAKAWTEAGRSYVRAEGVWEDIDLEVYASRVEPVPTDTDPDDLSDVVPTSALVPPAPLAAHGDASADADEFVCTCGEAYDRISSLRQHIAEANAKPIEDEPPRGSDAAEERAPLPSGVQGVPAGRHHNEPAVSLGTECLRCRHAYNWHANANGWCAVVENETPCGCYFVASTGEGRA